LDEIHPWLKDKLKKYYLYTSSFVVQVLILWTWMSFNNDGWCDYKGKYNDGTKVILKILFKKSFSSTMLNN